MKKNMSRWLIPIVVNLILIFPCLALVRLDESFSIVYYSLQFIVCFYFVVTKKTGIFYWIPAAVLSYLVLLLLIWLEENTFLYGIVGGFGGFMGREINAALPCFFNMLIQVVAGSLATFARFVVGGIEKKTDPDDEQTGE